MAKLRILMEAQPVYDYLDATIVQGLKNLGHQVFGTGGLSSNFLTPHRGEQVDIFVQSVSESKQKVPKKLPRVLLWGRDSGREAISKSPVFYKWRDFDVAFVRDYRGDGPSNVYPFNMGIEDRYYCVTDKGYKPLKERTWDVVFLGSANVGSRQKLIHNIRAEFERNHKLMLTETKFTEPDSYWTPQFNGNRVHDPRYFETLANSKLVLSPMGAGPDCARHWEAFASGGVPVIEAMPIVSTPPALTHGRDCLLFTDSRDLVELLHRALDVPQYSQQIADTAYSVGKACHTTKARAEYFLRVMVDSGIVSSDCLHS